MALFWLLTDVDGHKRWIFSDQILWLASPFTLLLFSLRLYTLHNLLLAKEQQCENHKVFVVYVKINSVKLQEHIGQTT